MKADGRWATALLFITLATSSVARAQNTEAPSLIDPAAADALAEQATGFYVAAVIARVAGAGWAAGEGIGLLICLGSSHTVCDENVARSITSALVATMGIGLLSIAIGLDVQSNRRRGPPTVHEVSLGVAPRGGGATIELTGRF